MIDWGQTLGKAASSYSGGGGSVGGAGGGGMGYSINPKSSADSTTNGMFGGSYFGGLSVGNGIDSQTMMIIGACVVLALLVLKR